MSHHHHDHHHHGAGEHGHSHGDHGHSHEHNNHGHSHGGSGGHSHSHALLSPDPEGPHAPHTSYKQTEYHGPMHTHGNGHPHSHPDAPGAYADREPLELHAAARCYTERAFTVGIGGPVGSGKTALTLSLCRLLRDRFGMVVVTNDIFTKEDGEFLTEHRALEPTDRIRAVETGGCPHGAIREDCSANLQMVETLTLKYLPDFCLLEAGGDNLSANFSRELADYIIYVIDVAGGDKIPRKGGPGITQADLLVINKTDLAEAVGADLKLMASQGATMRGGGPIEFAQVKHMVGVEAIAEHFLEVWRNTSAGKAAAAKAGASASSSSSSSKADDAGDLPPPLEPRD